MIPTVYIQFIDGVPATKNLYDCYIGFKLRGHKIIRFDTSSKNLDNEVEKHNVLCGISKHDILCAGIPVVNKVLTFLNVKHVPLESYPKFLKPFFNRKIKETTLGEVRKKFSLGNQQEIFLKPQIQKLFTGFVAKNQTDLLKIIHIPNETAIFISDTVNFISEYRIYVNQKNYHYENGIIGCYFYNGDMFVFPDPKKIKHIVSIFNSSGAPNAYALDVGVARSERGKVKTIVVETNDFTSLGNYGCPSTLYAEAVEERWKQIINV